MDHISSYHIISPISRHAAFGSALRLRTGGEERRSSGSRWCAGLSSLSAAGTSVEPQKTSVNIHLLWLIHYYD